MSAPLHVLIAERLDVSEDRARTLLQTMLREVRRGAAEEDVELSELGTFREDEDGTLAFEPSRSLRRIVNLQYEGLGPEDVADTPSPQLADAERAELEDAPSTEESNDPEPVPTSEEKRRAPVDEEQGGGEQSRPARSQNDSFQLIIGILLLAFLLAAGWFVLDQTHVLSGWSPMGGGSAPEAGPDTTSTTADTRTPAQSDTTGPARSTTRLDAMSSDDADTEMDRSEPAGNWTIVVASAPTRSRAELHADRYEPRFREAGLPVDIVTGTVDNSTRYRVTVGRYADREAALRALDDLDAQLPDGAWILKP